MILIDANIFMYAAGSSHRYKEPSASFLASVARGEMDAAVDAEILQEILHRYRAIGRWDQGKRVFDLTRQLVPHVIPLSAEDLDLTRTLMDNYPQTTARDALHAAVYYGSGADGFCSYDKDFDIFASLRRIEPRKKKKRISR